MSVPDLSAPYRAALVGAAAITAELPVYLGSYPVFTRVPVPDDAPYPMVVVSAQLQAGEEDGVADQRPLLDRDVMVYGRNDTAAHFRQVETIARAVHALFHRQKRSITVSGWHVADLTATGPAPAPVDDAQTVGRRVTVRARLAKSN